MKKAGLIGGLSPESTVHYYQYLCRAFNEHQGKLNFPELTLENINLQEMTEYFEVNDWDGAGDKLLAALGRLKAAGCDFAAILANTPHNACENIASRSPLPVLTIMKATAAALQEAQAETVILLGTKATMEYGFFQRSFQEEGIETITPEARDREELDRIIWEELSHGRVELSSRDKVKTMIQNLVECQVGGVVLGCTELAMLIHPEDSPVRLFDTARIHAQAILEVILGEKTVEA